MNDTEGRTIHALKFAHGHRTLIATGEKTATVRYQDEKGIEEGDRLSMRSPTGDEFATAEVTDVVNCPARLALWNIELLEASHNCRVWDELCTALNKHYDDAIHRETQAKVIVWDEVNYVQ